MICSALTSHCHSRASSASRAFSATNGSSATPCSATTVAAVGQRGNWSAAGRAQSPTAALTSPFLCSWLTPFASALCREVLHASTETTQASGYSRKRSMGCETAETKCHLGLQLQLVVSQLTL
jgi:hypothetical protein